ncbi:MAG: hypothetical protein ACHQHK_17465, partial [Dongiales bacterium]
HAEGRKTYGHALIVAHWGEVRADAGEEVGFVTARIDPAKIAEARGMVPALTHDRGFSPPPTEGLRVAGEELAVIPAIGKQLVPSRPPKRV